MGAGVSGNAGLPPNSISDKTVQARVRIVSVELVVPETVDGEAIRSYGIIMECLQIRKKHALVVEDLPGKGVAILSDVDGAFDFEHDLENEQPSGFSLKFVIVATNAKKKTVKLASGIVDDPKATQVRLSRCSGVVKLSIKLTGQLPKINSMPTILAKRATSMSVEKEEQEKQKQQPVHFPMIRTRAASMDSLPLSTNSSNNHDQNLNVRATIGGFPSPIASGGFPLPTPPATSGTTTNPRSSSVSPRFKGSRGNNGLFLDIPFYRSNSFEASFASATEQQRNGDVMKTSAASSPSAVSSSAGTATVGPSPRATTTATTTSNRGIFDAAAVVTEMEKLDNDTDKVRLLMKRTVHIVVSLTAKELEGILLQISGTKERCRCLKALGPRVTNIQYMECLVNSAFPTPPARRMAIDVLKLVLPNIRIPEFRSFSPSHLGFTTPPSTTMVGSPLEIWLDRPNQLRVRADSFGSMVSDDGCSSSSAGSVVVTPTPPTVPQSPQQQQQQKPHQRKFWSRYDDQQPQHTAVDDNDVDVDDLPLLQPISPADIFSPEDRDMHAENCCLKLD